MKQAPDPEAVGLEMDAGGVSWPADLHAALFGTASG